MSGEGDDNDDDATTRRPKRRKRKKAGPDSKAHGTAVGERNAITEESKGGGFQAQAPPDNCGSEARSLTRVVVNCTAFISVTLVVSYEKQTKEAGIAPNRMRIKKEGERERERE